MAYSILEKRIYQFNWRQKNKPPKNYPEKMCGCGKIYKPRTYHQKYCSRACHPYRDHSENSLYQTPDWKTVRADFKGLFTFVGGHELSNAFCVECFKSKRELVPMYAVDHIISIKDGGARFDFFNLQSLCQSHHQSKSAKEGNKRRYELSK